MVEKGYVLPGSFVVASRFALQHVRRARSDRHARGAHRRRRHLGDRRILVADPAHHPGRAHRQACNPASTGKDVIITLCGLYNNEEVLNAVVEFTGPGVASLSMDERLSIANMTTEWGTLVGWFPPDATTFA